MDTADTLNIVVYLPEIRLRPEMLEDFIQAYSVADMGDLEDDLIFSHITCDHLVVKLERLPRQFSSTDEFNEAYLARIREIIAPMAYSLN
jgi:hypothetical protein